LTSTAPGELRCEKCATSYPVKDGIPRFAGYKNYASSFGFQWNEYARTQLDSHTGVPISKKRLFDTTRWSPDLSGQVVLEAGSGAGRFTEVLLETGAEVYSVDYSSAVEANRRNNGDNPRLHLFQADICHLPFLPGAFDKVLCLGVLQHTADPHRTLMSLAKYVRPGGELVVDCYPKTLPALLQWKYLLRPITKRMDQVRLHTAITRAVPVLLPLARSLRRLGGRAGLRLAPILDYSHLGLSRELQAEWSVLDTFDMYSPAHDHPQSARTLERWFHEAGLVDIEVRRGGNGFMAKGRHQDR
jgi:SAM-dependent methyltransferase